MKTPFFKTALLASSLFFATSVFAAPTHINSKDLAKLQWQDVPFAQTIQTQLKQNQGQSLNLAGIVSPVAAYRIPANQGALSIEITSPVLDEGVFVPSVVVLDSQFNIATTLDSKQFQFSEERGIAPNRFTAELNLTPTASQDYVYLLVYTTAEDVNGVTTIPHPAKLYAKAAGNQPPAIKDIEVRHGLNGEVRVNVTNSTGTRIIGLPTTVFTGSKQTQTVGQSAPAVAQPTKNNKAIEAPVDKDTETYFNQAVTKALKAGDVNKAMNLVNEAEKLGLTSPRKIFLKLVSAK